MFDVGFFELIIVAIIGLFVIGPERLPGAIRAVAMWVGRVRYYISETRSEFEKHIGADDIRRELHNEQVMRSLEALKKSKQELEDSINASSQNSILPPSETDREPELPDAYPHDENGLALTEHEPKPTVSTQEKTLATAASVKPEPAETEPAKTETANTGPTKQQPLPAKPQPTESDAQAKQWLEPDLNPDTQHAPPASNIENNSALLKK